MLLGMMDVDKAAHFGLAPLMLARTLHPGARPDRNWSVKNIDIFGCDARRASAVSNRFSLTRSHVSLANFAASLPEPASRHRRDR